MGFLYAFFFFSLTVSQVTLIQNHQYALRHIWVQHALGVNSSKTKIAHHIQRLLNISNLFLFRHHRDQKTMKLYTQEC